MLSPQLPQPQAISTLSLAATDLFVTGQALELQQGVPNPCIWSWFCYSSSSSCGFLCENLPYCPAKQEACCCTGCPRATQITIWQHKTKWGQTGSSAVNHGLFLSHMLGPISPHGHFYWQTLPGMFYTIILNKLSGESTHLSYVQPNLQVGS